MTDPVIDVDPSSAVDFDTDHFPFPQLDDVFFSHDDDGNDIVPLEELDFDFSFDDLEIPLSESLINLNDHGQILFEPQVDLRGAFTSTSSELCHANENCSGVSHADSVQVLGYLNVDSPKSNGENSCGGVNGLNCPSPDTQGSGNYGSNVSEESNNCAVSSGNVNFSVVDQKVKLETEYVNSSNYCTNRNSLSNSGDDKCLLKRKKEDDDVMTSDNSSKCRKSNDGGEGKSVCNNDYNDCVLSEGEEKRRARLMRNRESAQLSRQRKKHYVEELEEKVRSMHSTIQDLNSKISYFMAENATLRQQMCNGGTGGGVASGSGVVPPAMVPSPPPGMYPHAAVMYPWMACAPPYIMKPQGSQVPLLPIPRLKPQQPTQGSKSSKKETSKKVERKGNEGPKTKKVAGVSFLGLLFFFLLVIGLAPMVNQRYGGLRDVFSGEDVSYNGRGFYKQSHGRMLMVNGTEYVEATGGRREYGGDGNVRCGRKGHGSSVGEPSADDLVRLGNESEPLVASLYVPRNDKLVKIDGNLIIHSILASEKAMASREKGGEETGLVPVPGVAPNALHLRAFGSGTADEESARSTTNDWKLQQWFREGLAGPMLSTGMCTKVFQFDVSAGASSGVIVEATTSAPANNSNTEHTKNSTPPSKARNRRFLHGVPATNSSGHEEDLNGNSSSSSSMVVSVLFDPREVGETDVDGVMGTKKSLSRIFVVVLIDSVKYVTYSCMLPFVASAPLVTT